MITIMASELYLSIFSEGLCRERKRGKERRGKTVANKLKRTKMAVCNREAHGRGIDSSLSQIASTLVCSVLGPSVFCFHFP